MYIKLLSRVNTVIDSAIKLERFDLDTSFWKFEFIRLN